MQKKLLAVAVAGALAAPGLALAQASNVQLYGILDVSAMNNKFSADGTAAGVVGAVTKGVIYNGASRWGLRGTEDLGNGLKAFFQLEAGVFPDARPDTNSSVNGVGFLGGRNSGVGLQSNWGQALIGIWDAPYKQAVLGWHVASSGPYAHFGMIMNNGDTTGQMPSPNCVGGAAAAVFNCGTDAEGSTTAFHRRLSNTVQYWSPVFNGFQFKIATQMGKLKEPNTTTPAGTSRNDPELWSYNVTWSGGPFSFAGAYETHRGFQAATVAAGAGSRRDAKDTALMLGGKWDFGMGAVGLGWEQLKYDNTDIAGGAADNGFKRNNWVINGSFKVGGNGMLWAGYSKTPGGKSCGAAAPTAGLGVAATCGGASAASFLTLGYDHNLSKRTALYAAYGKIDNGSGTAYYYIAGPTGNAAGGTAGIAVGTDVTSYSVGVKHSF